MPVVPGTRLAHYEITSLLGAGGMGEVYLAQDVRLERRVALKLLPTQFNNEAERLRRFELEAKAASALNHPNIITIYEIGEANGVRFIATEYVDGDTLRARISDSAISLREAADVAIQVASALAAAHAAGIVHRDIKPENIMLRRDGYVKVLDFGLARMTEMQKRPSDPEAETVIHFKTDPGRVMGTVTYMSPEQARGQEVDSRSDIFSLGIVLYEMLAGVTPFSGESVNDTLAAILRETPKPIAEHVRDLPPEAGWIVNKALAKNRDERYQTVKSLLSDLKRLKQRLDFEAEMEHAVLARMKGSLTITDSNPHHVVTAAHEKKSNDPALTVPTAPNLQNSGAVSSAEYLVNQFREHKRGALGMLLLVLLALVGIAWLTLREKPIESLAVLPFINASNDAETERLSDNLTARIISSLSQIPNLRVKSLTSVSRYKGQAYNPQSVASELGVQALLLGRVVKGSDGPSINIELVDARDNTIWSEQYDPKFAELLLAQQDISRDVTTNLKLALSGTDRRRVEAAELYQRGRYYWSQRKADSLRRSIDYFEQAIVADPNYALAHAGLADCYNMLVNYGVMTPQNAFPKAREAAARALELNNSLAEAHTAMAFIAFSYEWDWEQAERSFKRAIQLKPDYAPAHQWYASYLAITGRYDEAIAAAGKAKELDPLSLIVTSHLGRMYYYAGRYDEALKQFRETLALDGKFFPARRYIGQAYEEQSKYNEAIRELQESLTASGGSALIKAELGHAYAVAGKKDEARKILNELQTPSGAASSSYLIATLHTGLGDKDKAFEYLEKAFEEKADRITYLKTDPRFKALHNDPRYTDLLRRLGLAS